MAVALIIVTIITFVRVFPTGEPSSSGRSVDLRAAAIDQLYSLQPNEIFVSEITQKLEDHGFEVDLYQGDGITVDLCRQLPSYGYKLIVFRAHSGLLGSKGETIRRTCIFTNEAYSQTKHVVEQLSDQLAEARIDEDHPWVFGIGDEFITQGMGGEFDGPVIIMMGCSCLYLEDLAQAFIYKGASVYLARDATKAEVSEPKRENSRLKQLVAELSLKVHVLRKTAMPDPEYGLD